MKTTGTKGAGSELVARDGCVRNPHAAQGSAASTGRAADYAPKAIGKTPVPEGKPY